MLSFLSLTLDDNNEGLGYFMTLTSLIILSRCIKIRKNEIIQIKNVNNNKNNNIDNNNNNNNKRLEEKFALKDGLTFYYFTRSPCARRVWLTILSKGIKCNLVLVDLMKGEQRHPSYLKINPQGKVPAIVVRNHENKNISDCILYESQAIVEWLEETFPTNSLMPINSNSNDDIAFSRIFIKMWQYWELVLAEEIWPLSRQQVDGVIWRMNFSRKKFYTIGPPAQQSDDPFYKEKVSKIYEGIYLTKSQCRRSVIKILQGFQMLENALKVIINITKSHEPFLVNESFTQADIAVYPRLTKMPQNGIVCTMYERRYFPNVITYFDRLKQIPVFKNFEEDDDKIWNSGIFPKFVPQWWGSYLPWFIVVLIGNIRSGCYYFQRVTQSSIGDKYIAKILDDVNKKQLSVIPIISRDDIVNIVGKSKMPLLNQSPSRGSPSKTRNDNENYLFYHNTLPMASAVRICARLLGFKCVEVEIDVMNLQNFHDSYLKIMPFGEVPSLVICDKAIYGPHIIIELMHTIIGSGSSKPQTKGRGTHIHLKGVDELSTVDRAIVRRWFGWIRTTWYYQLQHFYYNTIMKNIRKGKTQKEYFDSIEDLSLSSPGREAVEEMKELYMHSKTYEELEPYACELLQRLQFVETELKSEFICGNDPTYADIFLLTIIITIEKIVFPLDPQKHTNIILWKKTLLNDTIIAGLCDSII